VSDARRRDGSAHAAERARRAREQLRRGSELAGAQVVRGLGEPALFAITLSAVVAGLYVTVGVVAEDALGLTPVVFLVAGLFVVATLLTYIEGSSLHPERGGASSVARYAFNEFWSFVAGWAILLDYMIVMAIGAIAITNYIAGIWDVADDGAAHVPIVAACFAFVIAQNIRGLTAERLGTVLRLSLVNIAVLAALTVLALAQNFDLSALTGSVELGSAPTWSDAFFAVGVATVAAVGIEAASGLAGEVRVGRRRLRRFAYASGGAAFVLVFAVSLAAIMALPVVDGETALAGAYLEAPMLGVAQALDPDWLGDAARYAVCLGAVTLLLAAMNGQMLGLARLGYSLATNRQIPSLAGRLHRSRGTPYVVVTIAGLIGFALALSDDVVFLAGVFAFGAMITFALAHMSVVVLRFRESERPSAFRMPLSVRVGSGSVPLPAAAGALLALAVWASVVLLHSGGRIVGTVWMAVGVTLYVAHRKSMGRSLTQRFTIPAEALQARTQAEYGSILVPVFGEPLDDEIVGTAGRLAAERADETEGGAVLEALYVFQIPMSLPIDARVPDERVKEAKRVLARAKEVGEEYEGVEVATAMVRGRTAGQAIVAEARRRGVEAIVLAAEEPSRVRGGPVLGGRGRARDRFVGETTRYVVEKAPCKVILTAPPAGEEGTREGVRP
jgi:basic amino acid/polyamine antiporter, APA family